MREQFLNPASTAVVTWHPPTARSSPLVDRQHDLLSHLVAIHLAEYKSVKDEQASRIATRSMLGYFTLAASGVVAASAVGNHTAALLLLLPPITVILGWTYLVTDNQISVAGRYLRHELAPTLAAIVGFSVLGWEFAHRSDRRRRSRKLLQLGVDLLAFAGLPLAALVMFWVHGPITVALVIISVLENLAVLVLVHEICRYADVY